MKKFFIGLLSGLMLTSVVYAQNVDILLNSIKVKVNGQLVQADNILYNGRTYVPLRAISEILNKDVVWDAATSTANINDKSTTNSDPNQEVISKLDSYIVDIETQTNRKIPQEQRDLLKDYVKNNPVQKLSSDQTTLRRKDFDKNKSNIIKEWETKTGQTWPTYSKDVLSDAGKVLRKTGNNYDAHHIIELSYGGANEWWNMHPAAYPNEHQGGIHRKNGIANELFDEE
jgi:predicted ribonuclease toxin of YeeF-YezG toxin-antitoxin module